MIVIDFKNINKTIIDDKSMKLIFKVYRISFMIIESADTKHLKIKHKHNVKTRYGRYVREEKKIKCTPRFECTM